MSSKLERIYASLPVSLQNLAVSFQGRCYAHKRYGKDYHRHVDELMRSQWLSAKAFEDLQTRELRLLILEAAENVPYYAETLGHLKGSIEDVTLADLKDIPFVEKEQLREETKSFINPSRLKYGYDEGHTSGTSGSALVWPYDSMSIQHDLAFRERQYRWAGITGKERSGRFSGRLLMGNHNAAPYWRHNRAENQWLFSTYHISEETLAAYCTAFKELGLAYLDGYPSALYSIAKWVNSEGNSRQWCPWAIITTAETLMDFQRAEIERAFGCRVFNFYSSSEGSPFITQCESGGMHINPESGIIEFLRADGGIAGPGEEAEIVVTSFFQKTMPLIRYRIGDTATIAEDSACSCGRMMPRIKCIGGRESDCFYTTERGRIGSAGLSTAFYKLPSRMRESQLEQIGKDRFLFRYVPLGTPLSEEEKLTVIQQFKARLGEKVNIEVRKVSRTIKGKAGKSRLLIGLKDQGQINSEI